MRARLPDTRRARLVLVGAVVAVLAAVGIASASLGGGATPPPRPLAVAVHRALTAPDVPGVSARIRLTNHLVSSGALPQGTQGSPLLAGADGRAWVAADGRFRLELQSEEGDDQIVYDGHDLTLYDGRRNTLYTARVPRAHDGHAGHAAPTLADVRRGLAELARHAAVSGAEPTNVAGRPAYQVTLAPKQHGGLLGALSAAWDAGNGVPLRLAVTARGSRDPVLELQATDISYGTVSADVLTPPSPAGARRVRIALPSAPPHASPQGHQRTVAGVAAVRRAVGFTLHAPARLAGRARQQVRLTGAARRGERGALVLYGHGLGGLALLELPAKPGEDRALRALPSVSIGGATGRELPTALGTLVRWRAGGVTYTLAGSLPSAAAEAAARELATP